MRELLDLPSTALAEKVETVTTPKSHPEQDAPARKETTAVKGEVARTRLRFVAVSSQDFTATLQTESRSNAHALSIWCIPMLDEADERETELTAWPRGAGIQTASYKEPTADRDDKPESGECRR